LPEVISTVAGSLFIQLFSAGAERLGSLVFQKLIRLRRIDATLKGIIQKDAVVITAVNDFETVIGSRYDKLTEDLKAFLLIVERSGLVKRMLESAIIGREDRELKSCFLELHHIHFKSSTDDGTTLFMSLYKSFCVTVESLAKDKMLLEAFRILRHDIRAEFATISEALNNLQLGQSRQHKLKPNELNQTLLRIAKSLHAEYRTIELKQTKARGRLKLRASTFRPPSDSERHGRTMNA